MSDERRVGSHPNEFSRAIRSTNGGGTIPAEWECRVVDLDRLFVAIGEALLSVDLEGRFFVWYREPPVVPVALVEMKHPADIQRAWSVTKALARRAGIAGFRVEYHADGSLVVQDLDLQTRGYSSAQEFIGEVIRPLIAVDQESPF